ncbi:hypothetical protein VDGD_21513 [Verticillium dahliae]|nr:hypothetical protein VDGD_21513 [Verticillium dahliae]
MQRRHDEQDELVGKLRQYGIFAIAAVVLLPPSLLVLMAAMAATVYLALRAAQHLGRRQQV